jgi:hypothetical protein
MDFKKYIGFKLHDVKPLLEENNIKYNIIEVWDNKKTQMGNDIRIINIKGYDIIDIYVAYF